MHDSSSRPDAILTGEGQQALFSPSEELKRSIEKALIEGDFGQAMEWCIQLKKSEPDNHLVKAAPDICEFWTAQGGYDALMQQDPLAVYRKWREFGDYMGTRSYQGIHAIKNKMKEKVFLDKIGLRAVTPGLRTILDRGGITALDLLVEIKKWGAAKEEIQNMGRPDFSPEGWRFFLTCSRVYRETGHIKESRRCLLNAFWDQTAMIQWKDITGIIDAELLKRFQEMIEDREDREEMIELIPCVGLLHGLFIIPGNAGDCLTGLRARIDELEGKEDGKRNTRISYRLFSLYAWEAELSERKTCSDYGKPRKKMKEIDNGLFKRYMDIKGGK